MESNITKSFWNERWEKVTTRAPTKQKFYYFSDYGRVKSIDKVTKKEQLLKGSKTVQGFMLLNLRLEGDSTQGCYIHKLVAEQFCPKENPAQKFVVHIDQDNLNNHYENLQWMTQREMTDFQIKNGVYDPKNRKPSPLNKMNPTRVLLLKKRLKEGKTKKQILAKNFNITMAQLRKIEKGIDWGYVTLEDDNKKLSS
ncbi:MAG: HNH endonuclease [uncultured Aureispira sp.]|uniref:HNH endonuclease n=1 Tax=uncultured Aureispira sp. TaxID=1331704 RepID=A0A6S6TRL5_9BACT|nr:MAG: HNH endonuclease [uncultured Aureispira sp.]